MIARRLVIHGRVQGVGYRHAMSVAATSFGVTGWVRNRRDGTVEVLVQGDAAAVERAIDWCRHGPPSAHVTAVDITDEPVGTDDAGFDLRPTV